MEQTPALNTTARRLTIMNDPALLKPVYQVLLNGRDLSPIIQPRLVDLTVSLHRGNEADQLDIRLEDADGQLAIPEKGETVSIAMGWQGGLIVDQGDFIIDEIEHSGAPDVLTLRGRSADFREKLKIRRTRSFDKKTLQQIINEIAHAHQLETRIDDQLGQETIPHIDQTNESDLAFLTRLGQRLDAIATIKKNKILFFPKDAAVNARGEALTPLNLSRSDGDQHSYHIALRDAYTGVQADWYDVTIARRQTLTVGASDTAKCLATTFKTRRDAEIAARAEWQRLQRGSASFKLTLSLAHPDIAPQTPLTVTGFKPLIDQINWRVDKVSHQLGSNGFISMIEAENSLL